MMYSWHERKPDVGSATLSNDLYPNTITNNDQDLEMAFFSYDISWLSVNRETMESSQGDRLARETILQIRELREVQVLVSC